MSSGVEVAHLLVEFCEFAVEQAAGQAAEAQVRTQTQRTGQQRTGVHLRTLEVLLPRLKERTTPQETCHRCCTLCVYVCVPSYRDRIRSEVPVHAPQCLRFSSGPNGRSQTLGVEP